MTASSTISRKRSLSDMADAKAPSKVIDDETYRTVVLRLSPSLTEEDLDTHLTQEANELGLMPLHHSTVVDSIISSLSATTLASDPNHQSSILSESTAPTSCSSSERRPVTQSSKLSDKSSPTSSAPSIISEFEKKKESAESGFRKGFLKMTGFRKRKASALGTPLVSSTHSNIDRPRSGYRFSVPSDVRSPASIKSSKSSWSAPPSATKASFEQVIPVDPEALRRTMESEEIIALRSTQIEERDRFLQYQRNALANLRSQHILVKSTMMAEQQRVVDDTTQKNEKAIDDLEARQLEEELKMVREHDYDKRATIVRLKHMEAYCQNPTSPPRPDSPVTYGNAPDIHIPPRKVTDKDYNNLAQVYRERDAMDVLHASKINVLRGKQKRAVENFSLKKEREIAFLEKGHDKEIERIDREAGKDEDNMILAFGVKRAQLETRWRLQALVETTKLEKMTGMKYSTMPEVRAVEND